MASLLLLIKTRRLSRRERNTVLRRVRVAINRRIIAQIDGWFYATFWNRDGYAMATVCATRRLRDEIRDVLHRNNFIAKTDVNLIVKTTNLATHSQVFNIFKNPLVGHSPQGLLYIYKCVQKNKCLGHNNTLKHLFWTMWVKQPKWHRNISKLVDLG